MRPLLIFSIENKEEFKNPIPQSTTKHTLIEREALLKYMDDVNIPDHNLRNLLVMRKKVAQNIHKCEGILSEKELEVMYQTIDQYNEMIRLLLLL